MRFLHTADWHVGKKLGRIDRFDEFAAVLDEIVDIASDQKVDAVIVAGDLFDRTTPSYELILHVVDVLHRLGADGRHVIAMPGNHDSAPLFDLLSRVMSPNVHLVPRIVRPEDGGVFEIPSVDGSESASIGVLPFLLEAQVVDFMADSAEWFKGYATRIRLLCKNLVEGFEAGKPGILVGHFFIDGAELGGGERQIHIGQQYAATNQSIPPAASYVALGHIHKPQAIPGTLVPARYSGSPLMLDFSERGDTKEVVIVDAAPGRPAKITSVPLSSGRKLLRIQGDIESLKLRATAGEFADAYLDVRVDTGGPVFGIAEQVREFLPDAVMVHSVYERASEDGKPSEHAPDLSLTDRYSDYFAAAHGVAATEELLSTLRELEEEVARETA